MRISIFVSMVWFAAFLVGCQGKAPDPHAGHNHELVKLQLAGYSSNYELYAESDPFSTGNTSSVLVHLTRLDNFKPLAGAKVTLSLIVGRSGIKQTVESSEHAGLYLFFLTPETEGVGRLVVDIEVDSKTSRIEVPNVKVFDDGHEAIHAAEDAMHHHAMAITFTKEQSWKIDFASEHPSLEPFGEIIRTYGQVQPVQGEDLVVSAKTSGVIKIPGEGLLEGKSVHKGDALVWVSGSGMGDNSWNVKFAEARNNYERSKADFERLQGLEHDRIVSEREVLAAKVEFENAKALFGNMNENFDSGGQRVVSPMEGFVKQLLVQNGQFVEAGQPLVAISQSRNLLIVAQVPQRYLPILPLIADASIMPAYANRFFSLSELDGRLVSYGKSANSDNYLIPITLQVTNKGNLVAGSFVELYLKTRMGSRVLTLPNSAILEEQGNHFVMLQLAPELFQKREVKVGVTDGFKTEILDGLDVKDRIVTKGAILVKLAQTSAALDPHSGHVH